LEATGLKRDHVCALARLVDDEVAIVIGSRLVVWLANGSERPPMGSEVWGETQLLLPRPLAGWCNQNVFAGELVEPGNNDDTSGRLLATVLGRFPVGLLRCGRLIEMRTHAGHFTTVT
jgi:(1->4)-alpha-D-glucan 1-alpha-D-glucosylmutase